MKDWCSIPLDLNSIQEEPQLKEQMEDLNSIHEEPQLEEQMEDMNSIHEEPQLEEQMEDMNSIHEEPQLEEQMEFLCNIDEEYVPKVGMTFKTCTEANEFYKEYAKQAGFASRIRIHRGIKRPVLSRINSLISTLFCSFLL
ncbi:hypothetical protein PIB30_035671 [Stylosanthes scabra]|uniref:Protein FAR1-RELATED SEQUENCE n=1 Tax=Stylosanthes scabra TaxID=79078 RepID=A0ABU6TFD4_9FABA|nr:hypothetical protein [Stylosanthes scabra]